MRRLVMVGVGAMMVSGCAGTHGPGRPMPIEGDSIRYETGPCFGRCPVYVFTVRPDGAGSFTGIRFTAVSGERAFRVTPEQYRAFAARLAPYRPASGEVRYAPGDPRCAHSATDMPSVDVTWKRAVGDSQGLYFYYGCDMQKNRAMADALGNAPDALPALQALIGETP